MKKLHLIKLAIDMTTFSVRKSPVLGQVRPSRLAFAQKSPVFLGFPPSFCDLVHIQSVIELPLPLLSVDLLLRCVLDWLLFALSACLVSDQWSPSTSSTGVCLTGCSLPRVSAWSPPTSPTGDCPNASCSTGCKSADTHKFKRNTAD